MKQKLFSGYIGAISGTSTFYAALSGCDIVNAADILRQVIPSAGNLRKFYVGLTAAPGSGKSFTFTVLINGSPSACTFAISDLATTGSYTAGDVAVSAGDCISLKIVAAGGAASSYFSSIIEYESGTANVVALLAGIHDLTTLPATRFSPAMGSAYSTYATDTEANSKQVMPCAGTITGFYVYLTNQPTSGCSRAFTIRINGGETGATTITYSNTESGAKNAAQSISVAAGDLIDIKQVIVSYPYLGGHVYFGILFQPTVDGNFPICPVFSPNTIAAGLTRYGALGNGNNGWSSTDGANWSLGYDDFTITALYLALDTSPGSGKSVTLQLRTYTGGSGSDVTSPNTVTLTNSVGPGNTTGTLTLGQLQQFCLKIVTDSGANTVRPYVGVLGNIATAPANIAGSLVNGPIIKSRLRAMVN